MTHFKNRKYIYFSKEEENSKRNTFRKIHRFLNDNSCCVVPGFLEAMILPSRAPEQDKRCLEILIQVVPVLKKEKKGDLYTDYIQI